MQVIVKVEDQLKFYKSQIGRAKSATALAWQMLSMCVPSKMILRSIYPLRGHLSLSILTLLHPQG